MKRSVWTVVVAVVVLACGCDKKDPLAWQKQAKKKMAVVIDAHRAASTARLQLLAKIGQEIQTAAPAATPSKATGAGDLPKAVKVAESIYAPGDTLLITPRMLIERDPGPPPPLRVVERNELVSLRRYLAEGWRDGGETPESLDRILSRLEGLKYVFVVRMRDYQPPRLATTAAGELRFAPGRVVGDAWLYELGGGKQLGVFPFDIVQDRSAYVQSSHAADEAVRDLEKSLAVDVRLSLEKQLGAFLRGEPVGAGTGPKATLASFERDVMLDLSAKFLAALISKVNIEIGGPHAVVTIHADSPGVLTTARAAPQVKAIVAKVLGDDEPVVKVLGNTK